VEFWSEPETHCTDHCVGEKPFDVCISVSFLHPEGRGGIGVREREELQDQGASPLPGQRRLNARRAFGVKAKGGGLKEGQIVGSRSGDF